jgi:branched-chain amino acid transport system substrate-binding protein
MALQPGDEILSKYRIDALINSGGFGLVYKATDLSLGRTVAIKTLLQGATTVDNRYGIGTYDEYLERFRREAQISSFFTDNPYIITVYGLERDQEQNHYLILEYLPGGSLADLIKRSGALKVEQACAIALDVCNALAAIHNHPTDIVHRDLKPGNILLRTNGRAIVADFGVAQIGHESHRTIVGGQQRHPGSPPYKSPEQASGYDYLTPASDLYTLGLVFYEMLTGKLFAKFRRLPPSVENPAIPAWLDAIVVKLLARDPEARYQQAEEVAQAINEGFDEARRTKEAALEQERRAEEMHRLQAEADEKARLQAEADERTRLQNEANERARLQAEADEHARLQREAETKVRLQREADERAKLQREQEELEKNRPQPVYFGWEQDNLEAHPAARSRTVGWVAGIGLTLVVVLIGIVVLSLGGAFRGDPTATTAPIASTSSTPTVTNTAASFATTAPAATTAVASATTLAAATTAPAATTAAASLATTAPAVSVSGGTIRIYSSLPMTGSSREQVVSVINAMKLALDDFTKGTNMVGNFKIDFVPLDDATAAKGQWDADQEKANANKAANDPDAMIYLGTFNSGASKVSIPILNQANMVMISPANTYTGLTKALPGVTAEGEPDIYYPTKSRNYFRVITEDSAEGAAVAAFVATLPGVKSVFVIDDSQVYGKGLADTFVASCKASNLDCTQRSSINGKESDYKSLAVDIKAKNPNAIFFGGITFQQAGKLVADIRAAGIKVPFIGGDGINDDVFIKDAATSAEGVYASTAGVPEDKLSAKGQDFLKRYRAKYGNIQTYTIYGYEAMSVALTAIQKANAKDRKAILDAAAGIKDFDGVLGRWSFDSNGDTTVQDFTVSVVKSGKWTFQAITRPKT